ncbi:MAG: type II toxin-antitoxin system PemK/MazF family toxin [Pyrinomonadaceae bacterium]
MPNFSRNEIVLIRFPFSDLSNSKIRPAIVVSSAHTSRDIFLVPLTSKVANLREGEFVLGDWVGAGLNVPSSVKRGIFSLQDTMVIRSVGALKAADIVQLNASLRLWFDLK